ncbi:DUF6351 family protein [Pseudoduganella sp. UC29_106]|uniref:DUF6351 family protein n=1 Tax=Pseudoduganella sp. UC29_106 TaxID=3374553 RepID=UPI0037571BDE
MKPWVLLAAALICGPVYAQQQPFVCRTQESGLGQPQVDNQDGVGHPVFDGDHKTIGYSRNCAIATQSRLFYYNGTTFKAYDPASPPPDMKTTTWNGATVPFVVKVEVGTINRFLYTIAMLEPAAWNKKLVYWLRGGVGIGHQQGTAMWFNEALGSAERRLMPRLLGQGYAVVTSSGNETGVHYNMRLAEETAAQTKQHFIDKYGKPLYTVGIGGSGGAVQQYMFAQNRPGLLDAGIPIQSYPDMVTQTIPISDCPLLGQYFREEVARDPSSPWAQWSRQAWIEGMNASDTARNPLTNAPGSTECISGWRMAMPNVLNPFYKDSRFDKAVRFYGYPESVFTKVKWTHWNDLADIYGTDGAGFAPIPLDNVGVQYGLSALVDGRIDADEFLRINACVGSWKEQAEFVAWDDKADPFDARNMRRSASCRSPEGAPAPRRQGSVEAMRRAYLSGHVFTGQRLGIPMIDLRPYLEPELNMHNARQSFSVRARLAPGEAARQVIWFTADEAKLADAVMEALGVLDQVLAAPGGIGGQSVTGGAGGAAGAAGFVDRCFAATGAVIASGADVWDGVLNARPAGACTRAFPIYSSPRIVAGDSIRGDMFKCALKPVSVALADGTYKAGFTPVQRAWLERIFPQGVCDYSQRDQGRPGN